jgi:serine/threonine protein phosphatase PrpC
MQNETALRLDVASLTDIGCKRTNNEDSFGYDLESRLFVVCDGMGGSNAGETASATAVKECVEYFCRPDIADLTREERLYRSILHANRVVHRMANDTEELHGMGTTLVSACVEDRRMIVGNVGDSRAYLIRGGVCAQITNDHSFVAEQVRLGSMNPEEAGASPYQSLITRAIGAAENVEPDIFTGTLEPGDIILLTTDGLTRYADAKTIASLILSGVNLAGACKALIGEAIRNGAVDNVTCVLVQFLEAEAHDDPEALDGAAA